MDADVLAASKVNEIEETFLFKGFRDPSHDLQAEDCMRSGALMIHLRGGVVTIQLSILHDVEAIRQIIHMSSPQASHFECISILVQDQRLVECLSIEKIIDTLIVDLIV